MSKKVIQDYIKKGDNIKTNVIFDNGKKFELKVEGEYKEMSNQTTLKSLEKLIIDLSTRVEKGFDKVENRLDNVETRLDKVETRLENVENRLDNIENRLEVVEKDIKDMKNTPTMLKELK